MDDERLNAKENQRNAKTGESQPEHETQRMACARELEDGATEHRQVEHKANPRQWNAADFRKSAVQDILTSAGYGAGNRSRAALHGKIKSVDHSKKGERGDSEGAAFHFKARRRSSTMRTSS